MTKNIEVKHELSMARVHLESRQLDCEKWAKEEWREKKDKKRLLKRGKIIQKAIDEIQKLITE